MKITTTLAGANFRPREAKAVVKDLVRGQRVTIEADPTNEYDANAIRIIANNESGEPHFIGFVAKANNVELAQALAAGIIPEAKVFACDGGLKPLIVIEWADAPDGD